MKSPSPWSYQQNATAVATSSARSALATRLRSSVRCAISDIVASGSRGRRRRRTRGPRPASVTVVLPGAGGSAGAVGRAALLRAGAELGGARLGDPRLLVQLRGQVTAGRRRGRGGGNDLAPDGSDRGGVLGADVVVLHALHLTLEDAQRAAQGSRRVRQLLVTEEQQDRQKDQDEFGCTESEHQGSSRVVAPAMLRRRVAGSGCRARTEGSGQSVGLARAAVACARCTRGRTSRSAASSSRRRRPAAPRTPYATVPRTTRATTTTTIQTISTTT